MAHESLGDQLLHRIRAAHTRRRLTWWERIYLPAIAQGLWVTTGHFWRNLFLHLAHRVGLFRRVPAAVTIQYPTLSGFIAPGSFVTKLRKTFSKAEMKQDIEISVTADRTEFREIKYVKNSNVGMIGMVLLAAALLFNRRKRNKFRVAE